MRDDAAAAETPEGASTEPLMPNPRIVAMIGDELRIVLHILDRIEHRLGKTGYGLDPGFAERLSEIQLAVNNALNDLTPLGDDGGNGGGH